jgi:hypothetical protein
MKTSRLVGRMFIILLALTLVSCVDQDANAPVRAESQDVTLRPDLGAGEDELHRQLEAEKDRIHDERERNKPIRDRLKLAWDQFRRSHKKLKRDDAPFPICDPLAYDAEAKIIGPQGGELHIGPHKLTIPKGALSVPMVITGEMPVDTLVSVQLSPHGLLFNRSVTLELSYKHCFLPKEYFYRLAYIDDLNIILELPFSHDKKGQDEVKGYIEHFSRYAVAY